MTDGEIRYTDTTEICKLSEGDLFVSKFDPEVAVIVQCYADPLGHDITDGNWVVHYLYITGENKGKMDTWYAFSDAEVRSVEFVSEPGF